jgi:hypothetical protein
VRTLNALIDEAIPTPADPGEGDETPTP